MKNMSIKDILNEIKINYKILMDTKLVVCAIVFSIIPLVLKIESWTNGYIVVLFEVFLPLVAGFFFSDLISIDKINKCDEVVEVNSTKKYKTLIVRMIIQVINMVSVELLLLIVLLVKCAILKNSNLLNTNFLLLTFLFIANSVLISCISNLIIVITNRSILGIMGAFFYWIIWQIGDIQNIFNPFAYSLGFNNYGQNKLVNICLSLIIFLVILLIYNRKKHESNN
ncbi:hypothetical protein JHL18_02640 [Clostridium sp. YIM B02505]|uniref:ABC-2 family transporter protein n=1 Tax=Clostridium yunnanense TaxID=2800325 RepID=A0ABS1EJK0_9CLOT|nr:hypothetical protein [Clostridium yunnanense]MBK1809543.1 hypothetical protein [Clostridium yunnanense]